MIIWLMLCNSKELMSGNPGSSLSRAEVEARKFLLMTFRSLFQMFRSLFPKAPLKKRRAISGGALVLIATTMWGVGSRIPKGAPPSQAATQAADFNRDILPIFQASCSRCHGADKAEARLRLDSEAAVLRGGVSGKAIISGS